MGTESGCCAPVRRLKQALPREFLAFWPCRDDRGLGAHEASGGVGFPLSEPPQRVGPTWCLHDLRETEKPCLAAEAGGGCPKPFESGEAGLRAGQDCVRSDASLLPALQRGDPLEKIGAPLRLSLTFSFVFRNFLPKVEAQKWGWSTNCGG